ncbi:MAG: two-component regulator propeller domain-containing protein, partial [Bacteroidota bacterium]
MKFNHLTKRDGLSSATVNYIFQDRKGYMWFGTMDGLSRFDGHNFVNYKHNTKDSTTIRENFVTSIAEDSKGKIWVGTRSSGISVLDYESGKFTHYHTDAQEGFKIHANIINNLYIDDQDNVMALVGGYGLEVYYQGADSFFHFDTNDSSGLRNNRLIDIQQATNGKFYLSTSGGSLEVFDLEAGKFEQIVFDENNKRSDGGFRPLLEDSKGNLWIGGTNGVHMMNTSTGRKA